MFLCCNHNHFIMRISSRALKLVAIVSPTCYARAFGTSGHSFPSTVTKAASSSLWNVNSLFSRIRSRPISSSSTTSVTTSTSTGMGLFDFLGGGGGGYSAKIDYSTLDYPGSELAALASEGKVPSEITRGDKTYKIATFAGGCFWVSALDIQYDILSEQSGRVEDTQRVQEMLSGHLICCKNLVGILHTLTLSLFFIFRDSNSPISVFLELFTQLWYVIKTHYFVSYLNLLSHETLLLPS